MKLIVHVCCLVLITVSGFAQRTTDRSLTKVKTANGIIQGTDVSGISIFKGIPFAQPPVGNLRWKEPQPVKNWEGTKKADRFSARPMQLAIYSDMNFRSDGISEDCLYLNIWTPSKTGTEQLPVLVYFYGGSLRAGDGSEYRYDGESMARRGIVTVTVNYRLGIFGFMAHPDLTKESIHHASGNYGFMDQTEALRWVNKNIAAFGGNPENVTIAGESAGSTSVNAQVLSPLPRNLFAGAIAESGSLLKFNSIISLSESEKIGSAFGSRLGASSISALRALPAEQILQASSFMQEMPVDVDGYFFPESPVALYKAGKIAKVPLIVGWNSEESGWKSILGKDSPTKENYINAVKRKFPDESAEVLKFYAVQNDAEVDSMATILAGDLQNALGSWRWAEMHTKTNSPVYRYFFTKARPRQIADIYKKGIQDTDNKIPAKNPYYSGAVHSAEIEYALGNLPSNRVYDWQPEDYLVSAIMQDYFLNFIKTKNPNGLGLPYWPLYQSWQKDPVQFIGEDTYRGPDSRSRFLFMENIMAH